MDINVSSVPFNARWEGEHHTLTGEVEVINPDLHYGLLWLLNKHCRRFKQRYICIQCGMTLMALNDEAATIHRQGQNHRAIVALVESGDKRVYTQDALSLVRELKMEAKVNKPMPKPKRRAQRTVHGEAKEQTYAQATSMFDRDIQERLAKAVEHGVEALQIMARAQAAQAQAWGNPINT